MRPSTEQVRPDNTTASCPSRLPFRIDWAFLGVLLAPLLAIYPLLPAGIPSTADGPLHLIRSVEFDAVLRAGVLYPRWAPDLAYGYGYPLFNYYAPLFYYVVEIPHLLGASFELALKLTIFAALYLYAIGVYWWTRPLLGSAGAAVAAVAYVFFAFRFHESYAQGDYPQFLAFGLAPFAFGAMYRLFAAEKLPIRWIAGLALGLGAILLTHNISALWVGPTIAAYAVGLAGATPSTRQALVRLVGAAAAAMLAIGLTAFFWLPALTEQGLVQLDRLRTNDYDVRHSFIDVATLLSAPHVVDQTAANPPLYLHLGWGHLFLALLTLPLLVIAIRSARRTRLRLPRVVFFHLAFGWALLLTSAALTLPISGPVWRHLPLVGYTEYAWRLLQLSALALALLAGVAVRLTASLGRLTSTARLVAIVGVATAILAVPSLVYLYPRQPFLVYGDLTATDVTAFERNGGAIGTTSTGEYYPRDVTTRPSAPLPTDVRAIGHLDRATLPEGSQVAFEPQPGYAEQYQLTLPRDSTLLFDVIRFPGWEVAIDGQLVPTRPSAGEGLLIFDAPAGRHLVSLQLVDTPVRRIGWLLTFVAVAVLVGLGALGLARKRAAKRDPVPVKRGTGANWIEHAPSTTIWSSAVALTIVILALLVLRVTSPAPYAAIFARASPLDRVIGSGHPLQLRLEDKVLFLGYDVDTTVLGAGGTIKVTLYWRALRPLDRNYRSLAMITRVGDQGLVAEDDRVHPGGIPSKSWDTTHYVVDAHTIAIPADLAPLVYQLQVALYDPSTGAHLRLAGGIGRAAEQVTLQQIHIPRAAPVDPGTIHSLGKPIFGGEIAFRGYQLSADHFHPGDTLDLTLVWRAEKAVGADYTVFTHLVDANQKQVAGNDGQPVDGQFPTSTWLPGEDVVDSHHLAVPRDLPPGTYHLAFGLYDPKTMRRLDAIDPSWTGPRSQIDLDGVPISVQLAGP